jgi:ribosome maturation factor RimP
MMNIEQIRAAFEACAVRHSAHLVDLVVRGTVSRAVIEVYVDSKDGVSSELCAAISRDVAETIDREGWFRGSYRLEVSSPGIDRPLLHAWQYPKHLGRVIEVSTVSGDGPFVGELREADDQTIGLLLLDGETHMRLGLESIRSSVVRAPW